jgi:glycine/D-amino acid oxidase-like deaminating enzyme
MKRRIVVIGGGIVGSSIAYHLVRRGADVVLLDRDPNPPRHASRASFAWMNARDKHPREYHDLNRRSLDLWQRFADTLSADIGLRWGGDLRWTKSAEDARESETRVALLQSWGYQARNITREDAEILAPGINFEGFSGASISEGDGLVDAIQATLALQTRGVEVGLEVKRGEAVVGLGGTTRVESVVTDRGKYPCDVCVIAAGADTADIAAFVDVVVPMYDTFGATLVTGQAAQLFDGPCVMHGPKRDRIPLAIRQSADGTVVLHGGQHGQMHDASYGQADDEAAEILKAATTIAPALKGVELVEVRRARRPIPKDGQSIVGFDDKVLNLYVAATHSGVTLAPLIGLWAATEVLDGVSVDLLAPFRLSRFGGHA